MALLILLVLAALWAVVLLPPLLRSRSARATASDSIGEFSHKLGVLSRTNGNAPSAPVAAVAPAVRRNPLSVAPAPRVAPAAPRYATRPVRAPRETFRPPADATKRRADVMRILVATVAVTFALAYFTDSPLLWGVQILADVCLVAFVGLLVWSRNRQALRAEKVRYLPQRRQPELALRRTASS